MAGVARAVGTIAGAVALVASFMNPATAVLGIATAGKIAAVASGVAAVSGVATQLLAKPPRARGSATGILIQSDAPSPYLIGRTAFAGVLRHDVGYGGRVNKVDNPYRAMVIVYSVAGPVQALPAVTVDHQTVGFSGTAATGYYANFLYRSFQLGATPESSALAAQWSGMPGWGAASKLSGKAAILFSFKFDKDGKRFASGIPPINAIWQGVRVYDPRLDSTRPGGSGSHRANDETTWAFSENPALHGIAYLLGRRQNGVKVFGVGMPVDGIDMAAWIAFANVCDANGWKAGGTIFEPGDRWDNLRNIAAAGGGEPVFSAGQVSVIFDAPRVALATITAADLADGPVRERAMQSYRVRLNCIVPKYRSEAHKWEYVASDEVTVAAYVTEDGEVKTEEIQWNLVQDKDQAAKLAGYKLVNGRELIIEVPLKPEWRIYRPGNVLHLDIVDDADQLIDVDAVMLSRRVDPQTLAINAVFRSETSGKHDFALGRTGTAPPTPTLIDPEDRDNAAVQNGTPLGFDATMIATSSQVTTDGLSAIEITATDVSITIPNHVRRYQDKDVSVTGATISGLISETPYWLYYPDPEREGGAVTYSVTNDFFEAFTSGTETGRHFAGGVTTAAAGGTATGAGALPPGAGGINPYNL
jgi:hypothetical protein